MIVVVLDKVNPTVEGKLSRWMMRIKPSVLVGDMSARVRDRVQKILCLENVDGLWLEPAATEQGFKIIPIGNPSRKVQEVDGLFLVANQKG